MDKMHVYHISLDDLGNKVTFKPRIPEGMIGENNHIPRICVCPTIMGCIRAIAPSQLTDKINKGMISHLYLYDAFVDVANLYQPNTDDVPDIYITGELWVMKETRFTLLKKMRICKHLDLPFCCYSRYAIYPEDENITNTRINDQVIYGQEFNFSYIDFNQFRVKDWD